MISCSFCNKEQTKVKVLVTSGNDVNICEVCAGEVVAIVAQRLRALREKEKPQLSIRKAGA